MRIKLLHVKFVVKLNIFMLKNALQIQLELFVQIQERFRDMQYHRSKIQTQRGFYWVQE